MIIVGLARRLRKGLWAMFWSFWELLEDIMSKNRDRGKSSKASQGARVRYQGAAVLKQKLFYMSCPLVSRLQLVVNHSS